jgi:hypothetical protein
MGNTPPILNSNTFFPTFGGTTPDNFTIKRPAASAAAYTTWIGTYANQFNNSGSSLVFADTP